MKFRRSIPEHCVSCHKIEQLFLIVLTGEIFLYCHWPFHYQERALDNELRRILLELTGNRFMKPVCFPVNVYARLLCVPSGVPTMHVDVIAPTQKYTYSHPIDGTPYEYKRMDDNSREIATTTWHNNRLITLTNPAEVAIQAGGVQPMRSERWIDPAGRMIISHRVCPENTEFLKIPASDIRDITGMFLSGRETLTCLHVN